MSKTGLILLAEDEETDAYFVKWAFKSAGLEHRIVHVWDGQEALDYLQGTGEYCDRGEYPLPDLMLLDLKMPRLTGFDVLGWWVKQPNPTGLPIVVLTSSSYDTDRTRAMELGAADYVVKPGDMRRLGQLVVDLDKKWLSGNS